ncbi:MAG: PilX N-terminal domain-containing pilus assembly protein [Gemmatimonadaceae bacterium]
MYLMNLSIPIPYRQRGAVLFVALVFLVLITLLGLTAAGTSVLQERMTGGLRNNQLALMGAESADRGVEATIWNKSNNLVSNKLICGPTGGNDTCYSFSNILGIGSTGFVNTKVINFRRQSGWPASTAGDGAVKYSTALTAMTGSKATASLAKDPRYLIEDLGMVLPPGSPPNGNGGNRDPSDPANNNNQTLHSYRITARATGGNDGSVRSVESLFIALRPSN